MSRSDSFPDERLAITALNDDFGYYLDHGNVEAFLALFSEDVKYSNGARNLSGKLEMTRFFESRAKSDRVARHLYSGLRLDFVDPTHATGTSLWLTFAGSGSVPISPAEPFVVADVKDVYRIQADGSWAISERAIIPVFVNKAIPAIPNSYEK